MKICVIGAGRWGHNHIRTLSNLGNLGGIVESQTTILTEFGKTYPEAQLFENLNDEYFVKFNFPFIMAVKEKNKSEIISSFLERKDNSKSQERSNALHEINKIAWLRIKEIYGI